MGNPNCPYGCGVLELETHNHRISPESTRNALRGQFYVCKDCNHHWPRSVVISRNTSREGAKPKGASKR